MKRVKICSKCRHRWNREGLLPFDASCDKCGAALHACVNCALYDPFTTNGCHIQATERDTPPFAKNFCGKFIFRESVDISTSEEKLDRRSAEQKWNELFGD